MSDPVDKEESSETRRDLGEASHATVSSVLGLLAHDLRNPLAALSSNVGFLTMMRKGLDDDVAEAVDDLQLSVEALGRIIDSLELVSHDLGAGKVPAPSSLHVGSLVRGLLPQVERAATSHGTRFAVVFDSFEGVHIHVSETFFRRALSALVHNAITAAPPNTTVELRLAQVEDELIFRVLDEGVPLDPELAEAALSAAGQSNVKTARGGRYSRGLGLYAVARSAELAGAELHVVQSASGSVLELRCPAAR